MSVLAIASGTTGVTALIVTSDGTVAGRGYRGLRQYFPQPGWVEQLPDPEGAWQATLAACSRALRGCNCARYAALVSLEPRPRRDELERLREKLRWHGTFPRKRVGSRADARTIRVGRTAGRCPDRSGRPNRTKCALSVPNASLFDMTTPDEPTPAAASAAQASSARSIQRKPRDSLIVLHSRQHGVISRRQAKGLGLSLRALRYRSGPGGSWQQLLPGVYLTDTATPSSDQFDMAALLHAGRQGTITGVVVRIIRATLRTGSPTLGLRTVPASL
jgi:hypothetical protein